MTIHIIRYLSIVICFILWLGLGIDKSLAQDAGQASEDDTVRLEQFGMNDLTLRAPLSSTQYAFALPATWTLLDGATLQLHFTANLDIEEVPNATLTVTLNEIVLETIVIDQAGSQTITIPIPLESLTPLWSSNRHLLRITFDSHTDCILNDDVQVIVHPDSSFIFPHKMGNLPTDLTKLPFPLFQYSFIPNDVVIVVPDHPTANELRAALSVAAGWGQITNTNTSLTLVQASGLAADVRTANHIILVGKPDTLPQIAEVQWSEPLRGNSFNISGAKTDDGIIQMATSPWNKTKAALLISGQNDAALVKAAQAFSSGSIQSYTRSDLGLVSQVQREALVQNEVATDRTLANLGYETILIQNDRTEKVPIDFQVPSGQAATEGAFFELVFAHSTLIDHQQSRVKVKLNGELIGTVPLSEETANITRDRIMLPPSVVRTGLNELEIDMAFVPLTECNTLGDDGTWFAIYPDSLLHLPLQALPAGRQTTLNLFDYPDPFIQDLTLSKTAVILPSDDVAAWQTAMQLILDLSRRVQMPMADPIVAYAENIPNAVRQGYDLLLIGQPSRLPFLEELGETLPVAFVQDSDDLATSNLPFVYRRPPGTILGYLEMFPTPWHNGHYALLVSGNSADGVQMAATALANGNQRNQMIGNVTIIDGEQLLVLNKQQLPTEMEAEVNTIEAEPVTALVTADPVVSDGRPIWMLPLLITSVLAIIGVAVGVATTSWRRRIHPE